MISKILIRMIIGYLIAVRDVYGFTSRGLSIASLLFAVTGSLLLGEVFAISQACLFLVAAFLKRKMPI